LASAEDTSKDLPFLKPLGLIALVCLMLLTTFSTLKAQMSPESASSVPQNPAIKSQVTEGPLSVTRHSIVIKGKHFDYTATAGYLPMKDETGQVKAYIVFVAYARDGVDPSKRPITFAYNGGPGAASTWLHLGALGPTGGVDSRKV
jgi:carboxypeptidase C (cathepsin A)